jgi:hypothetical protein
MARLILSGIFFSPAQLAIPPTNPISFGHFDLQTPVATFNLPGCHAALLYVVHLRHWGAVSPPPPLPLRIWSDPIISPSPFPSFVTSATELPSPLPPSP